MSCDASPARLASGRLLVHIPNMPGWKFIAEFRRGRKNPVALECFVVAPDFEQAQKIAATKLVGADTITAEPIPDAELARLDINKGEVVFR